MNFSPYKVGKQVPTKLERKMLLEYLANKNGINTKTKVKFRCDECSIEYIRRNLYYEKMKQNECYDKDYCVKCWRKVLNNRPSYRKNMIKILEKRYEDNPEIKKRISDTLIASGANIGDKNGMKQREAQKKVSAARKKMFQDPKIREHYAKKTREAWASGKMEGVKVGRCKWYDYKHSNGIVYKVQGKWELAFIKWLDSNDLSFRCHRGRIPYILDGVEKNYYPDFWVDEWEAFVDVKCKHFYREEKFAAIKTCNSDTCFKILFKSDLEKLGVTI